MHQTQNYNMNPKKNYLAPQCEALELHLEGVIAVSDPTYNPPFGGNQEDL